MKARVPSEELNNAIKSATTVRGTEGREKSVYNAGATVGLDFTRVPVENSPGARQKGRKSHAFPRRVIGTLVKGTSPFSQVSHAPQSVSFLQQRLIPMFRAGVLLEERGFEYRTRLLVFCDVTLCHFFGRFLRSVA